MPINLTKLNELIQQIDKLVSLPSVYYRLESLIESPTSSVKDFAQLLGTDADLCARLLNLANSAFYCLPAPVEHIEKAVATIGIRQIRELVLVTSVMNMFQHVGFELDEFWRHNIAVGIVAKHIAKECQMQGADKIYVPGLLHDIGRLALFLNCADEMKQLMAKKEGSEHSLTKLEYLQFGFSHAEVGGALLRHWRVPESIVEPVMMHHSPRDSYEFHRETSVINVADCLVKKKFVHSEEAFDCLTEEPILVDLDLSVERALALFERAQEEINAVCRQFINH